MTTPQKLTLAGTAVQSRLAELDKSQQWLADEMNSRRDQRGIHGRVQRATLWRWMTGKSVMNVDDATLIEAVVGVPAILWSQYANEIAESAPDTAA